MESTKLATAFASLAFDEREMSGSESWTAHGEAVVITADGDAGSFRYASFEFDAPLDGGGLGVGCFHRQIRS